jgi:TfoX/Sxy family transcriptional regulator of competence genes
VRAMSKVQYNPKHKEALDSFLLDDERVKSGKMFGHPAYYVVDKLFASLYMDAVCVKLPEARVKELIKKEGYAPFQPMGRKMREWILITHKNSNDYLKDKAIFQESVEYVTSLTKK